MDKKFEFERFVDSIFGDLVLNFVTEKETMIEVLEENYKDSSFSVSHVLKILEDDRYINIERIELYPNRVEETGRIYLTDKGFKDYTLFNCSVYTNKAEREVNIDKSFEHTEQSYVINKRVLWWAKLAVIVGIASIVATIIGYFISK